MVCVYLFSKSSVIAVCGCCWVGPGSVPVPVRTRSRRTWLLQPQPGDEPSSWAVWRSWEMTSLSTHTKVYPTPFIIKYWTRTGRSVCGGLNSNYHRLEVVCERGRTEEGEMRFERANPLYTVDIPLYSWLCLCWPHQVKKATSHTAVAILYLLQYRKGRL